MTRIDLTDKQEKQIETHFRRAKSEIRGMTAYFQLQGWDLQFEFIDADGWTGTFSIPENQAAFFFLTYC